MLTTFSCKDSVYERHLRKFFFGGQTNSIFPSFICFLIYAFGVAFRPNVEIDILLKVVRRHNVAVVFHLDLFISYRGNIVNTPLEKTHHIRRKSGNPETLVIRFERHASKWFSLTLGNRWFIDGVKIIGELLDVLESSHVINCLNFAPF